MASMVIDKNRLSILCGGSQPAPAADRLFRDQSVFFVGGNLPVYETLETMFDSFCMAATALFYLTIGSRESLPQGEEMARQIKKNFHSRLMARLDETAAATALERLYAAGVDNVDFHLTGFDAGAPLSLPLQAALQVFPRWGVAVTLPLGAGSLAMTMAASDRLLHEGIVPLLQFYSPKAGFTAADSEALLEHLLAGWEKSSVNLAPYLPLLSVTSPLVVARPAGLIRGLYDRFCNRRQLAECELRRHLRVPPADSLDSAGL